MLNELKKELKKRNEVSRRSKWSRGVGEYAVELLEELEEHCEYSGKEPTTSEELKSALLNGAENWEAFSYGGCSLIYDYDICERLATPSEKKKTKNGELNPNKSEDWLQCQARALTQACSRILKTFYSIQKI